MTALPNRYADPVDEDDDIDMDDWLEMSEEEQDRLLDASMRQLEEAYRRLTPLQKYRISRRNRLRLCISWRNQIRNGFIVDLAREKLRDAQILLVKLRVERATGIKPGAA